MTKSISLIGFALVFFCFFLIYKNSGGTQFYNSELNSILQTIVYLYIGAAFAYSHSSSSTKKSSLSSLCISLLLESLDTVSHVMRLNAKAFDDSFDDIAHMAALKKLSNKIAISLKALEILKIEKESNTLKTKFFDFKKATTKLDFNKNYNENDIARYYDSVRHTHDNLLIAIDEVRLAVINK